MSKSQTAIFDDYQAFYAEAVKPLKSKHPDFIRLDGKLDGSNRKAFAYFKYQGQIWKVDSDTYIEKLDIGLLACQKLAEPFIIKPTRDGRGKCLIISGQTLSPKRFYIYLSSQKSSAENGIK